MSGYAIPKGKKKPYPYQDVKVFTETDKAAWKRPFGRGCIFCDSKKAMFSRHSLQVVVNHKQIECSFFIINCDGCGVPEESSVHFDDPKVATIFMGKSDVFFRDPYGRKLDRIAKDLEQKKKAIEAQIASLKR